MVHIGEATNPRQKRRLRWAQNLKDQLDFLGWTPKKLVFELGEIGVEVSRQAVDQWLDGSTAPSPENQGAIAKVLRSAPHILFPIEVAS